MFEKSALLMICRDVGAVSCGGVHLACEGSAKANKKNCKIRSDFPVASVVAMLLRC